MTNFEKVGLFMKTFKQEVKTSASLSSSKITNLRVSLIEEELTELKEAIKHENLAEVADALTDILYVTYGAGHAFGLNLDACFNEVQKSKITLFLIFLNFWKINYFFFKKAIFEDKGFLRFPS